MSALPNLPIANALLSVHNELNYTSWAKCLSYESMTSLFDLRSEPFPTPDLNARDRCIAGQQNRASSVCQQCLNYLCDDHIAHHKADRFTATHTILSISDFESHPNFGALMKSLKWKRQVLEHGQICSIHCDQISNTFCLDCQLVTCPVCVSSAILNILFIMNASPT